jgi:hypothetical protein
MGKKENQEENNFLDMWGVSSTMFKSEDGSVEEVDETVLKTVDGKEQIDEIPEPPKAEEELEEPIKATPPKTEKINKEETSEEVPEFLGLIESLADVLAIDDEKEYEPNTEGLKVLIKDTAEKAGREALNNFKTNLGEREKFFMEVLEKGGTIEDALSFAEQVDYSTVALTDNKGSDIERNQLNLVADWMKIQGFDQEDIDEKLEDLKTTNLLHKEAKLSQKKLIQWQESEYEKFNKEKEEKLEKEKAEQIKADAEFKDKVLKTTEIAGFKISSKDAQELYDYITKPVSKDGKTKFAKEDSEEGRLLYAYFRMKGFDKEKLSKEITTKNTIKLKQVLSNYQDTNTRTRTSQEMRRNVESLNIPWSI